MHIRINNNFTSSIHIIFLFSHSLKSQINPKQNPRNQNSFMLLMQQASIVAPTVGNVRAAAMTAPSTKVSPVLDRTYVKNFYCI